MLCNWDRAWIGLCRKKTEGGPFCEEHKGKRCSICGKEASHDCDHASQFVCGEPLCNGCDHFSNRDTLCLGCKKHPSVCMCKVTITPGVIATMKEVEEPKGKKPIAQRMREQTVSATQWIYSDGYKEVLKKAIKQADNTSSDGGYQTIVKHPFLNFYCVATQVIKELVKENFTVEIVSEQIDLQEQFTLHLKW